MIYLFYWGGKVDAFHLKAQITLLYDNYIIVQVTKILGNEWSSLSLENKKEYLEKSELDKKRYREELKIYRNSDAYRSYLKRRRIKS